MAFRTIVGLEYAAMCLRPRHIPKSKPRGSKAAGLRFERALAAALPPATPGQWFEFMDANGPGNCQTDLLIVGKKRVVVIECKLSDVEGARAQLVELYCPVVQAVWPDKKPLPIVAARHLLRETHLELVVSRLDEAIKAAEAGKIPTFHWMERTKVGLGAY